MLEESLFFLFLQCSGQLFKSPDIITLVESFISRCRQKQSSLVLKEHQSQARLCNEVSIRLLYRSFEFHCYEIKVQTLSSQDFHYAQKCQICQQSQTKKYGVTGLAQASIFRILLCPFHL